MKVSVGLRNMLDCQRTRPEADHESTLCIEPAFCLGRLRRFRVDRRQGAGTASRDSFDRGDWQIRHRSEDQRHPRSISAVPCAKQARPNCRGEPRRPHPFQPQAAGRSGVSLRVMRVAQGSLLIGEGLDKLSPRTRLPLFFNAHSSARSTPPCRNGFLRLLGIGRGDGNDKDG
ncbi:hypothetical protein D9M72_479400 [compost metagenome]